MNGLLKTIIIVTSIAILGLITYLIFVSELTNREAGLISLLLTLLSFIVSYMISNYFAKESYKKAIDEVQEQHQSNLRTYALNAAEKVGNLSNELTRLSLYLQEHLEYEDDNDSPEISIRSLEERIESTIHIINTLKSVNDTSLSDWSGVIGDELDEQKEERLERENELKELVSRVEELVNYQDSRKTDYGSEIKNIKKELSMVLSNIGGSVVKQRKSSKPQKEDIVNACPNCLSELTYMQRPKENSFKPVKCSHCGMKSTARFSKEKGFYLEQEQEIEENTNCPWCNESTLVHISSVPYTSSIEGCSNCDGQIKILKNITGFKVYKYGQNPKVKAELDDDLIQKVDDLLPEQPWPTGTHKDIATKLGIPHYLVSKIITKLIEQGKYFPQVNGVIYEKKKE
ncbi:hypothetical protein [Flagellimonas sp.]|uniref:hypothetical protein n=1 Tax=Flagellimonas sp. TaxID=2058762 RepID=UPI003AB61FF8